MTTHLTHLENVLLVKGAVPGSKGGDVIVRPAAKFGA